MLVDLGRNDLGKISKFGTVQVEKLHSVERFSHVMHIGSTVRGEITEKHDALDAIEAVLPAGTLSGAPKIRACQLIGELENNKRGIYGGAIGYIDFTGNMDTCIAIRIAYKKNGKVFVESGARDSGGVHPLKRSMKNPSTSQISFAESIETVHGRPIVFCCFSIGSTVCSYNLFHLIGEMDSKSSHP